jgi:hypothetical protein
MARAIAALSVSAAFLPRPFAAVGQVLSVFWHDLTRPYRPELHYMRGPGPAWRAKHSLPPQG